MQAGLPAEIDFHVSEVLKSVSLSSSFRLMCPFLQCYRVYGPRVAALGKKGKQGVQSSLALAKDLLCQSIISKRQLPCELTHPHIEAMCNLCKLVLI